MFEFLCLNDIQFLKPLIVMKYMLRIRRGRRITADRLRAGFVLTIMTKTESTRATFGISVVISLVNISLSDETSPMSLLRIFPVGRESK